MPVDIKKRFPKSVNEVLHHHINISKYSIYQLNLTHNFRVQDPTENILIKKFTCEVYKKEVCA